MGGVKSRFARPRIADAGLLWLDTTLQTHCTRRQRKPSSMASLRSMRLSNATEASLDDTELVQLNPVEEAALYIQDALDYSQHCRPRDEPMARKLHKISLYLQPWIRGALATLVALTFFELPAWCARTPECRASLNNGKLNGAWESGSSFFYWDRTNASPVIYPLFGLPIAPPAASTAIEMVIHLFLFIEVSCDMYAQGALRFLVRSPTRQVVYVILLFFACVDGIVRAVAPWPAGYFAPYLRMSMLCSYSPAVLYELRLVGNTFKPLSGIIIVLGSFLLFTSWVGIILFASKDPGTQGATYFVSWAETAWQLFICLTTANYPDVMMPAYKSARFSFLFFSFFLTIGTFFLLNVVIAVVCNEYNSAVEREGARAQAPPSPTCTATTPRHGFPTSPPPSPLTPRPIHPSPFRPSPLRPTSALLSLGPQPPRRAASARPL